jgi:tetraacyldisaccharide 4'-kinase
MRFEERWQVGPLRPVLRFLSWLFAMVVVSRNKLFDWGVLRSTAVRVPVISVGNISVGGTGKTPLVELIATYCLNKGKKVAILSRGYRRESRGVVVVSYAGSVLADAVRAGDEPVQMASKLPGASVVVSERRVEAAEVAVNQLHAEVLVLDDGFQHRYLHRDVDIVVIDSRRFTGRELLLPAGSLREPWVGLRRAHTVVFSKVGEEREGMESAIASVRRWYGGPLVRCRNSMESIHRASDHSVVPREALRGKPLLAFSGIGDHAGFVQELASEGLTVKSDIRFPDHHRYSRTDVGKLAEAQRKSEAEVLVTTEKDVVRMMADQAIVDQFLKPYPVYYTRIAVQMVAGKEQFLSMIDACLSKGHSS